MNCMAKKVLLFFIVCSVAISFNVFTISADDDLEEKKKEIEELEKKLQETKSEKQTLTNTINGISSKINYTENQIEQTQETITNLETEIKTLDDTIDELDFSLDKISAVFARNVVSDYKRRSQHIGFNLLISDGIPSLLRNLKYSGAIQNQNISLLKQVVGVQNEISDKKVVKQEKQEQYTDLKDDLVVQERSLESQQAAKQATLRITQNNERRYQSQLANALAELEAIQSIVAGNGSENSVREVSAGDTIASIIRGASTCSNGSHLHFETAISGSHVNPTSYLNNTSIIWDNAPDTSFGFSGSWPWPVDSPVRITQGYGMTFYAATMRYYGGAPHTGIDMMPTNGNFTVKAVADGTLFRGSIRCGRGNLRYVKVDHKDSDIDSFYLHVNY